LFCELFIDNLRLCKDLKKFKLYGFVVLPDHVHLMILPNEKYDISKVMQAIKINFSREINKLLCYKPAGEKSISRMHAVNLDRYYKTLYKRYGGKRYFPKFSWQKSFYDRIIRDISDFNSRMNYIWCNAIKHNLKDAENYLFSSYKHYQDLIDKFEI